MAVTLKLQTRDIVAFILGKAKNGVNKTLQEAKKYAESISPTDTKEYIESWKIKEASLGLFKIEGELYNDAPHAEIVENGVLGRAYKYHKGPPRDDTTVIYEGVGNRTAQRTSDAMQFNLPKNIKNG